MIFVLLNFMKVIFVNELENLFCILEEVVVFILDEEG